MAQDQGRRFSFAFQNIPLVEVLDRVAEVSGLKITYVNEAIPERYITGYWTDVEISSLLDELLLGELLTYDIDDTSVIIYAKRSLTQPFRLFGRITDNLTGEVLTGANIYTNSFQGVESDKYGLYSLEINPQRDSLLLFSYLGYRTVQFNISYIDDGRKDIQLEIDNNILEPVTITIKTPAKLISIPDKNILNEETYSMAKSISGDRDVMELINVIPGATKVSEGKSGFSVHGSATDQNLILIDEAPVFNPSHALGFISVFNHDALNSAQFHKTDISSQYGGRLASVLDIRMREGNAKSFSSQLTTNPFYSGLTLEGPIIRDRASFLVSGRHSHMNYILDQFDPIRNYYIPERITFYDVHGKINFQVGQNNRFYLSTFLNNDEIRPYKNSQPILFYDTQWQNRTFTGRWNSIWNKKIFTNLSYIFSDYEYNKDANAIDNRVTFNEKSTVSNQHLKLDINYHISKSHQLLAGFNAAIYEFEPATGKISVPEAEFAVPYDAPTLYSQEYAFFIEDNIKIGQRANINLGVRYSKFFDKGNDEYEISFDSEGLPIDSFFREKGQTIRTFDNIEPRASFDIQLASKWLLDAAWSRTSQYIIQLLSENPSAPNEYWIPAGPNIKPLTSDVISVNLIGQLNEYTRLSVGLFKRNSDNVSAFKNGSDIFFTESLIDRQATQGQFNSSGIELSLKKSKAPYRYIISYAYTNADVTFADINEGESYEASNNYTHDLNIQASTAVTPKILIGANWQLRSGDLITQPSGIGYTGSIPFPIYNERNNFRLAAYHRLDISTTISILDKSNFDLDLSLGIFNATGTQNAVQVKLIDAQLTPDLETLALFKTVPFLNLKMSYK